MGDAVLAVHLKLKLREHAIAVFGEEAAAAASEARLDHSPESLPAPTVKVEAPLSTRAATLLPNVPELLRLRAPVWQFCGTLSV